MTTFTVSLKACRINANKTQLEWAKLLGVTNVTVNNWESGKTSPTLDKLRIISELSGIPMDYILSSNQI